MIIFAEHRKQQNAQKDGCDQNLKFTHEWWSGEMCQNLTFVPNTLIIILSKWQINPPKVEVEVPDLRCFPLTPKSDSVTPYYVSWAME